jgi:hypothetical protein
MKRLAMIGGCWLPLANAGSADLPDRAASGGMSATAPTPVAWHISPQNYAVNLILSDGTAVPSLELRDFFAAFLADEMREAAK